MKTNAYAAQTATTPLAPFNIQRRDVGKHDVSIEILYCGVCHAVVETRWQSHPSWHSHRTIVSECGQFGFWSAQS